MKNTLKIEMLIRFFNRIDTINYIMKYNRVKIDIYDLTVEQLKYDEEKI